MTPFEQAVLNTVAMQRNQALDAVANLQAELSAALQRISELEHATAPKEETR